MPALYVHVPFCASVCPYCDFATMAAPPRLHGEWLSTLRREALAWRERPVGEFDWGKSRFDTLYFGGGTPSILDGAVLADAVEAVRGAFEVDSVEATIEANPDDVSPEKIALWKELGFTRVSLGVQSLDDRTLRAIGRVHDRARALSALSLLLDSGLSVTADLMFALPGQSAAEFLSGLRELLATGVPHLSFYGLGLEGKTLFAQRAARGELGVDEEIYAECYSRGVELCAEAGLARYELSNFARPGFESRHNRAYWRGEPYLGLGPGAHGYDGRSLRFSNPKSFPAWRAAVLAGEPAPERDPLGPLERFEEAVWLGLRLAEGFEPETVAALSPEPNAAARLMERAGPWIARGALERVGGRLRLRGDGWLLLDEIAPALFPEN